ncbi:TPA: hypothetical protein ACTXXA_002644 [Legionella anisa]
MSRAELHQEIVKILETKMQERGIQCDWNANANGIVGRIDKYTYVENEQILKQIFGRNVARNQSHNVDEPVSYKVDYQSPAKLIELLNTLGETDKAIEYQKAIEQENKEIAAKLNRLMQEDQVQWKGSIDGVLCTHIQKIPVDAYNQKAREAGERAFKEDLNAYGVTVIPGVNSALGIEGRFDTRPGLVRIDASYISGDELEELHAQVDKALVSGVTRDKISTDTEKTVDTTSPFKDRLGDIKQEQIDYRKIFDRISKFCDQYPNVDGLKQMQEKIGRGGMLGFADETIKSNKLNSLIEIADWKKSDSDFTKGFHHKMRGRAPEVEEFYQQLAQLDPKDPSSVEKFISFVDKELDKKNEKIQNIGYS